MIYLRPPYINFYNVYFFSYFHILQFVFWTAVLHNLSFFSFYPPVSMNIYVLDLLIQVGAATSHGVEMIYVCVGGGGKVF